MASHRIVYRRLYCKRFETQVSVWFRCRVGGFCYELKHHSLWKCALQARRTIGYGTRIVGSDNAFMEKSMLDQILGQAVPIDAYLDSRTVFNVVAKEGSPVEKRLQIVWMQSVKAIHMVNYGTYPGILFTLTVFRPPHQSHIDFLNL